MYKILFLLAFPFGLAAQGPIDGYLKEKGSFELAPSLSFNNADLFSGAGGKTVESPYSGRSINLFGVYGLHRDVNIVAVAAAVFTPTQSGLQDGGLFLKYRPVYKKLPGFGKIGVLAASGINFPLSNYKPTETGALGLRAVSLPVQGILQWETPVGVFLNLTGGYHFRLDRLKEADIEEIRKKRPDYAPVEPPDHQTLLIKAGVPRKHFYFDAWAEWQFANGGIDFTPNQPDLAQSFGVSYTQVGATIYYSDNGRSGFFINGATFLKGRNISLIRRVTVGFVWRVI